MTKINIYPKEHFRNMWAKNIVFDSLFSQPSINPSTDKLTSDARPKITQKPNTTQKKGQKCSWIKRIMNRRLNKLVFVEKLVVPKSPSNKHELIGESFWGAKVSRRKQSSVWNSRNRGDVPRKGYLKWRKKNDINEKNFY